VPPRRHDRPLRVRRGQLTRAPPPRPRAGPADHVRYVEGGAATLARCAWDDGIDEALSCATCSSACATTRSTERRWYASGAARLGSGAGYCTPPHCVLSSLHPSRPLTPHAYPRSFLRPPAEHATLPKAAQRGGVTCVGGTQHTGRDAKHGEGRNTRRVAGRDATHGDGWPFLQHAGTRSDVGACYVDVEVAWAYATLGSTTSRTWL
jgi:hypothetical protein